MKQACILAHFFPPFNGMAARRPSALARHLPEHGWKAHVICTDWHAGNTTRIDPASDSVEALEGLGVTRVGYLRPPSSHRHWRLAYLGRLLARPRSLMGELAWRAVPRLAARRPFEFYNGALKALRKHLRGHGCDVILATCPPAASLAVADRASREFGIPWIADFRDVWEEPYVVGNERYRQALIRGEPAVVRSASAVLTVSEGLKDVLSKRHAAPIEVLPNGFDPYEFDRVEPVRDPRFHIVYAGTVYCPYRDPGVFLDALDRLVGSGDFSPDEVLVSFVGTQPADMGRLLRTRPHARRAVEVRSRVPYREAIAIQKGATVLLHLAHRDMKGILTGKLFEYLAARRPILCVPGDGDCVDRVLQETQSGVACQSASEVAEQLLGWFREWKRNGSVAWGGVQAHVDRYSRRRQAGELAAIFEEALNGDVTPKTHV